MKHIKLVSAIIFAFSLAAQPLVSDAQVSIGIGIGINIGPPALPVYVQPPVPAPGYIWTPGYWSYADDGYFWVPGVWVAPPSPGLLWTPGYWGCGGGYYNWHPGYWATHVGFYGGLNYGFGYFGHGFYGGGWFGNVYRYNTAYANVNTTIIHNTYVNNTYINNTIVNNHTSFNGPGGVIAAPSPQERYTEQHFGATSNQLAHQRFAQSDRTQFASYNHGAPPTTAMNQISGRRFNQQGRIANGIASGQLTPRETRNLEGRESALNGTIRSDRAANGGTLTPWDRYNANRTQNAIGSSIYQDKHNAAVARYGSNTSSRNTFGKNAYGSTAHGNNPYVSAPHGSNPYVTIPHGSNPYASTAHGSNPYGVRRYNSGGGATANVERRPQYFNRSVRASRPAYGGAPHAASAPHTASAPNGSREARR